jgi:hypothetical protein
MTVPFGFVGALLLGAMGFVGAAAALMYVDRDLPTRSLSVSVEASEVVAGGQLVVRYAIERTRDCEMATERTLWDGAGEQYRLENSSRLSAGPLGEQSYRRVVTVPASAAPGMGRYRVVVAYRCNPMHRLWPIRAVVADVFFTIVATELPKRRPAT